MMVKNKVTVFIERLYRIGIDVKLVGNYPWVYIDKINEESVAETFRGEHGFTLCFTPIEKGQQIEFTDISEIFKLLRKYVMCSF